MKTILTICLIFLYSIGMAQKSYTIILTGNITCSNTSIAPLLDTIPCWFKEIIINHGDMDTIGTNGYNNLNNAVQEFWQHGYKVCGNHSVYFNSPNYVFYYLYADRKTKVTNHVIYSIIK
jgi:hypothetical protein